MWGGPSARSPLMHVEILDFIAEADNVDRWTAGGYESGKSLTAS
jgi:hypothetical protein